MLLLMRHSLFFRSGKEWTLGRFAPCRLAIWSSGRKTICIEAKFSAAQLWTVLWGWWISNRSPEQLPNGYEVGTFDMKYQKKQRNESVKAKECIMITIVYSLSHWKSVYWVRTHSVPSMSYTEGTAGKAEEFTHGLLESRHGVWLGSARLMLSTFPTSWESQAQYKLWRQGVVGNIRALR